MKLLPPFLSQWLKSRSKDNAMRVPIANFGIVTASLFRGALPDAAGYRSLASHGIYRVVNLIDGNRFEDRAKALTNGIEDWLHIEMRDDAPPSDRAIQLALEAMRQPGAVYIHCLGGRHRTGLVIACYRLAECGFTKEQAWAEAKRYGFYSFPNHGGLEKWFFEEFNAADFK